METQQIKACNRNENLSDKYLMYSDHARHIVKTILGFTPNYKVLAQFEPQIREIFRVHVEGKITHAQYVDLAYDYCVELRNRSMEYHGWHKEEHTSELLERYATERMPFISIARERFKRFLDYYPDVKFSLIPELVMREMFSTYDFLYLEREIINIDYWLLSHIKYHEVYDREGKEAADQSPLIKGYLIAQKKI
ncbi:hypothetical protein [Ferruginibacter albus]|uniref:hypothetical protein n=1 Tax=Ferruginibacter albus TaxID=2875540 RepID=UPI001CC378F5|nr:hypothetical protein [Ferruginibacter albus]UAY53220.1 hypothetical protein K9M53_06000 [Ferruginibacter albus]